MNPYPPAAGVVAGSMGPPDDDTDGGTGLGAGEPPNSIGPTDAGGGGAWLADAGGTSKLSAAVGTAALAPAPLLGDAETSTSERHVTDSTTIEASQPDRVDSGHCAASGSLM